MHPPFFAYIPYILLFLFGCAVGSFLNVLAWRLPEGEQVMRGRSRCRGCGKTLRWQELIPILSYILLRGRCAACRTPISLQYPLIELATGVLFVFLFLFMQTRGFLETGAGFLALGYVLFVAASLIVIFITDLREFLIPDAVVIPAAAVSLAVFLLNRFALSCRLPLAGCSNADIIAAVGGAAFFLALVLLSRGAWMGLGDVKLVLLMGLFLGAAKFFFALFAAFLGGSVVGMLLVALRKKNLKSEVPFGAFLAPAALFSFFAGDAILEWIKLAPFRW